MEQTTAVTTEVSIDDLRTRFAVLCTAADFAPERLTTIGSRFLQAHQRVAAAYGMDSPEEIYEATTDGSRALLDLRDALPGWFSDEAPGAVRPKRTMCDIRNLIAARR